MCAADAAEVAAILAPADRRVEAPAPAAGVLVRAAALGDAARLGRMFSRCSGETIRLRFHLSFSPVPRAMLDKLAHVGADLGEALVAAVGDEVVGHAMYAREGKGDREAEVAVVVEDGWSSKGVGRLLLAEISVRARWVGVGALTCTTLGDNRRFRDVARRAFPDARMSSSDGACSMRLPLG